MAEKGDDTGDLFASPSKEPAQPSQEAPRTPSSQNVPFDAAEAREAALRKELEGVRSVNETIEGAIETLERASGNMETVVKTVGNASTLLNMWTSILSQTEHTQRLILNPNWKGASQDLQDIESEAIQKQQAAERRAAEEERRREAARIKAEEDERQRQAGTSAAPRGPRGSRVRGGRGISRGASSTNASESSSSTYQGSRGGSGQGRGTSNTRGRIRGPR